MLWYEDEIVDLENKGLRIGDEAKTLFYGSSSIRLWESLDRDFADFKPANLGFGGSTLAACVWFFDRVMASYQPERLIFYAGDNDLGDGRHPEEVFIFFQQLVIKTNRRFGNLPCHYISLKPSPSRWHMLDKYKYANHLIENEITLNQPDWQYIDVFEHMINSSGQPIEDYFMSDGLHLSERGYHLWATIIHGRLNSSRNY